jgi:DNA-binding NarL/FixJ family response regulator
MKTSKVMSTLRNPKKSNVEIRRVLIFSDTDHLRENLRTLLDLSEKLKVVGEVVNVPDAMLKVKELQPDVVLIDLETRELGISELVKWIKAQLANCRVLALSIIDDTEMQSQARLAGIDFIIDKGQSGPEIIQTIFEKTEK